MKERRSFSFGCAKIHELPISVFLLSFSVLAGRCQSCVVRRPSCSVSVASCARCQSRCAQSPRRQESRVIGSSVVLRRVCHLVVRRPAARRQSGCALGV